MLADGSPLPSASTFPVGGALAPQSAGKVGRAPGGDGVPFLNRAIDPVPAGEPVTYMYVGTLSFDLLLGDIHSLKEKRSVVRPIVAELQRKFAVSAAEVDHLDLHRRAGIGLAMVSGDTAHLTEVLDRCERLVAARPEVELLSVRRRFHGDDD